MKEPASKSQLLSIPMWGRNMTTLSQIRASGPERNTIADLVISLRQTASALSASIAIEEERTKLSDHNDPSYSTLAKSMRKRLENLRCTIAMLEAEREAS